MSGKFQTRNKGQNTELKQATLHISGSHYHQIQFLHICNARKRASSEQYNIHQLLLKSGLIQRSYQFSQIVDTAPHYSALMLLGLQHRCIIVVL